MFVIWDLYTYYCMKIFVINKNVYITYNVTNPAAILTFQRWTTSNLKIEMTLTFGLIWKLNGRRNLYVAATLNDRHYFNVEI